MSEIYIGLAAVLSLVVGLLMLVRTPENEPVFTNSFTLEIKEFTTTCGVKKYRCFVPELGRKYIEVLPVGFKPIFDDLIMDLYGLSLEQMYNVPVNADELTPSVRLYRALRMIQDCEVEIPLSRHDRISVKVVFITPKPCLDLPCAA